MVSGGMNLWLFQENRENHVLTDHFIPRLGNHRRTTRGGLQEIANTSTIEINKNYFYS